MCINFIGGFYISMAHRQKEKRADFSALVVIRNVFHNISNLTVENFTKHLNCIGAYTFVSFQSGNLAGADMMLFNQGVLGNTPFFHNVP